MSLPSVARLPSVANAAIQSVIVNFFEKLNTVEKFFACSEAFVACTLWSALSRPTHQQQRQSVAPLPVTPTSEDIQRMVIAMIGLLENQKRRQEERKSHMLQMEATVLTKVLISQRLRRNREKKVVFRSVMFTAEEMQLKASVMIGLLENQKRRQEERKSHMLQMEASVLAKVLISQRLRRNREKKVVFRSVMSTAEEMQLKASVMISLLENQERNQEERKLHNASDRSYCAHQGPHLRSSSAH